MNNREDILLRKARLVELAAGQRIRLAHQLQSLQPLFFVADRGMAAMQSVRAHPAWVATVLGIVIALRPRRAIKWFRQGLIAWRAWRWARNSLKTFMSSR